MLYTLLVAVLLLVAIAILSVPKRWLHKLVLGDREKGGRRKRT